MDDVLQEQYEKNCWATPDRVGDRFQNEIAARLLEVVAANDPETTARLAETLAHAAVTLGRGDDLDPWDVLAFRAPVDFRSHRVLLTDPPALSPNVRAVQAQLLRQGVAVVGERRSRGQCTLEVTSYNPEWAYTGVRALLPNVEIEWLGKTAREIKPVPCAGWRKRGDDEIRVWVSLEPGEHIDEVVAAESDGEVAVLAYACTPAAGSVGRPRHEPIGIYLESSLGERVVVDGFSGDLIPDELLWGS